MSVGVMKDYKLKLHFFLKKDSLNFHKNPCTYCKEGESVREMSNDMEKGTKVGGHTLFVLILKPHATRHLYMLCPLFCPSSLVPHPFVSCEESSRH